MKKFLLILGIIWASPVTLAQFLYVAPLWILGHYRYAGWTGLAWRWNVRPRSNRLGRFIAKRWQRWGGQAGGNIILIKSDRDITVKHEHEHVRQCMRLGIIQPILYALFWLTAKVALRHADAYYDNLFEIDARRAANQLIDITGTVKRLKEEAEKRSGNR